MFHVPNYFRVKAGPMASDDSYGSNGMFVIPAKRYEIYVVASDGEHWEHVSITLSSNRLPNWTEMCAVKDMFWDPVDCVMQLHPPVSQYVNNHKNCLHLWRPVGQEIPIPPSLMVGVKSLGTLK